MSRVIRPICRRGGEAAEKRSSTRAAVMRATSMRDGAFSSRLMVGWEHRSPRPLSGARPTASDEQGIAAVARRSSSASSYPQASANCESAASPSAHVTDNPLAGSQRLPDATRQRLGHGRRCRLASTDQAAVDDEIASFTLCVAREGRLRVAFLRLIGWQIEREQAIFGHGGRGAFVAPEGTRLDNEFLHDRQRLTPRSPPHHQASAE